MFNKCIFSARRRKRCPTTIDRGIVISQVLTNQRQLESRLGIRLLQRTTRSVSLTEAGSQYLSYCQQALEALQSGDDFIAGLSQEPAGKLRVSVPQNLVEFIMSSVIAPFLEKYPKVNLEIIQSNQHMDLIKHHFDVAVRSDTQAICDTSLIYRQIYQSPWALVASQSFIKKYGQAKSPQELLSQPSVGVIHEVTGEQTNNYIYWKKQKLTLKHRFATNNLSGIFQALNEGLGFAIVPRNMIKKSLKNKELTEINPEIKIDSSALYVVYPSRSGQPANLKAFVDVLIQWGQSMSQ